jgi:hypothetical protein
VLKHRFDVRLSFLINAALTVFDEIVPGADPLTIGGLATPCLSAPLSRVFDMGQIAGMYLVTNSSRKP